MQESTVANRVESNYYVPFLYLKVGVECLDSYFLFIQFYLLSFTFYLYPLPYPLSFTFYLYPYYKLISFLQIEFIIYRMEIMKI